MTTDRINKLSSEIDNTLEMTSICRSEWCRSLESEVDRLEGELEEIVIDPDSGVSDARVGEMSDKVHQAYRNLKPDVHI